MSRQPRVYDALTMIPISLPDCLPVLPDTGGVLDSPHGRYGNPGIVSDRLDLRLHHVYSKARIRDGPTHPNRAERGMFWNDRAVRHEAECLRTLDVVPTMSIWCGAWDDGPLSRAEDLADLIAEYDGSHPGRIDHLLVNREPYRRHGASLLMIPECRLPGTVRGRYDGSRDIRVITSMNAGRNDPHYLYAVNSSLAFRIQSPVTFYTYKDRPSDASITTYTESHQYICTRESGFKIGLGAA